MPRIISTMVEAYIFRQAEAGTEYLLLKRNPHYHMGGTWEGVRGHIDKGETAYQAAFREIMVDTGVIPLRLFSADNVQTFYEVGLDAIQMVSVFAAQATGSPAVRLSIEHVESRWLAFETAYESLAWPGQRTSLQHIHENIARPGAPFAHLYEIQIGG
ncbi:MAG: NUDIX domain-containing protein [Planctomycetes bacterium]|nr:NUDIX domain-containing protein [Planctomycetota bacterium]